MMSSVYLIRTLFTFIFLLIVSLLSYGPINWLNVLFLALSAFVWSYVIGQLISVVKFVYRLCSKA